MSTNQPKPIPVGGLAVLIAGVAIAVGLAGAAPTATAWVQGQIDPPRPGPPPQSRALPAPPGEEDALSVEVSLARPAYGEASAAGPVLN